MVEATERRHMTTIDINEAGPCGPLHRRRRRRRHRRHRHRQRDVGK